jgi:5-methylcytosine-specific restriction protein A
MVVEWQEQIGTFLTRQERSARYGGAKFGGIEPSRDTPNVFVYSDPDEGEAFGYNFDGWNDDDAVFLYTGEGQVGDQLFRDGNKAVLNHDSNGRTLRLFVADGLIEGSGTKRQRYVGAFRLDTEHRYFYEQAPDRNGDMRTVIVFRLVPEGEVDIRRSDRSATGEPSSVGRAVLVDVEAHEAGTYDQSGSQPATAVRAESELVERYLRSIGTRGHTFKRWKIVPPGEIRPLYTDPYDEASGELIEAKGTATRRAIREAIGQLFDYRRHIPVKDPGLCILLPHRPSDDLLHLLQGCAITCIYETDRGVFERAD